MPSNYAFTELKKKKKRINSGQRAWKRYVSVAYTAEIQGIMSQ